MSTEKYQRFNVIKYAERTEAIADPSDGELFATIREIRKRNGSVAYEVKGYSKRAGKHPDLEGIYEARGNDEAIAAAMEIANRERPYI